MKKRSVILILIVAVVLLVLFLKPQNWFSSQAEKTEKGKSWGGGSTGVNVVVVKPELLKNKIYATGTVMPNEKVELRSEISGRIVGIYFKEDTPVSKGQLLVKINDSDFKAQLKKIRLQEKLASEDESRKKKLLEIKGISQEEYDRALNLVHTLSADGDLLESQIAKTEIRAPFNGVVGLRHVSEGGYLSPTALVATMQQLNPVKIEFAIPEKYAELVKKGSKIDFYTTDKEKKFTGNVYAASTQIDFNTRSLTVRALAPNPDRKLTPGAFVKIEFTLENIKDALLIPTEALIPELGGQKVFVIHNDTARAVKVETGIRTEKEVQITHGLKPSDTVAVTGLLQLKDLSHIKIKEVLNKESLKMSATTN